MAFNDSPPRGSTQPLVIAVRGGDIVQQVREERERSGNPILFRIELTAKKQSSPARMEVHPLRARSQSRLRTLHFPRVQVIQT